MDMQFQVDVQTPKNSMLTNYVTSSTTNQIPIKSSTANDFARFIIRALEQLTYRIQRTVAKLRLILTVFIQFLNSII